MLDKCMSFCSKFPDERPCAVCCRKQGIAPKAKRTVGRSVKSLVAGDIPMQGRQRYENRTYKYMKVRPNSKQAYMRMPQAMKDFVRAHITRK